MESHNIKEEEIDLREEGAGRNWGQGPGRLFSLLVSAPSLFFLYPACIFLFFFFL